MALWFMAHKCPNTCLNVENGFVGLVLCINKMFPGLNLIVCSPGLALDLNQLIAAVNIS